MADTVTNLFRAATLSEADAVELPAVAVKRMEYLRRLAHLIHDLGMRQAQTEDPSLSSQVPEYHFHRRKAAWDVLNKWVFHFVCSVAEAEADGLPLSSIEVQVVDEPVLPSQWDGKTHNHLASQLRVMYGLSDEQASLRMAKACMEEGVKAANDVARYAREMADQWRTRLDNGRKLTSAALGLSLRDSPTDDESLSIVWKALPKPGGGSTSGANGGSGGEHSEHSVELYREHFDALQEAYLSRGNPRDLLLARVFALLCRYDALSEDKSAYQAAIPRPLLEVMHRFLGVRHECFASPLNRYAASFCSAFPDTDRHFGSSGPFHAFFPSSGSYEANPPFDHASVERCFRHIGKLLGAAHSAPEPLSFVVVIPRMEANSERGWAVAYEDCCRRYERMTIDVPIGSHAYLMGLQHRRQARGERYWAPEKASRIYVLQNDAGYSTWPPTEGVRAELLDKFRAPEAGAEDRPEDDGPSFEEIYGTMLS